MRKLLFILYILCLTQYGNSQTITLGTATTANTSSSYPAPYGNWYFGARHQFIIRKTEINTAGVTGAKLINSLAFNVKTIAGTALNGFEIKLANSSLTAFPSTGYSFQSGFTSVYGPTNYTDVAGWNTHNFTTPFYWDGVSNIIVEVCFNNSNYTSNALTYYSAPGFVSSAYRYADLSGNCVAAATAVSSNRPNMKLVFATLIPPVASFICADTFWVNIPSKITNTSTNYISSYWDISGLTASRFCNALGCFIDSNKNLTRTFTTPGTYEVKLVAKGYLGADSIKKTIHVLNVLQKPKANFYASSTKASTPNEIFFYDSSLFGVSGWEWSMNPICYGCAYDPYQFPNTFMPSVNAQNPYMYLVDAGVFDVCLKVWNDLGPDSICKQSYINVSKGYYMCNGADSFSNRSNGVLYDVGGADQNYQIGLIGQCTAGFVISPSVCADSIILIVDQFRLRTTDTLQIRDGGTATSPILKKLTGINLATSNKTIIAKSGKMFLRMTSGTGTATAGDSGFVLHWNIHPTASIITQKTILCGGDSVVLRTVKKSGYTFNWKYNGLTLPSFVDSFCYAKYSGYYQLAVTTSACADSSSITLNAYPNARTNFHVNNYLQCVNNNSFVYTDSTVFLQGKYTRLWNMDDDNSKSTDSIFTKKYTKPGTYFISLITTTDNGCKDSTTKYIRVSDAPISKIEFATANSVCENDSVKIISSVWNLKQYKWFFNNSPLLADTQLYLWTKLSGNYVLKVTDDLGCDSVSEPVNILFKKHPAQPLIFRVNDSLKINNVNSNQWFYNDSVIVATNKTYFVPKKAGKYTVFVDSNGCSNISTAFRFSFTGNASIQSNNKLVQLFPNPSTTSINVLSSESFHWQITDITGRILLENNEQHTIHEIDITSLSKGVYFIKSFHLEKISITRFEKL